MRGSTLVMGVRENMAKYPNLCKMIIYLYDDEDKEHLGADAEFVEDLFAHNANERTRFIRTLDVLEKDTPVFISVKITESHVILFYKTANPKLFSRKDFPGAFDSGN